MGEKIRIDKLDVFLKVFFSCIFLFFLYYFVLFTEPPITWLLVLIITYSCVLIVFFPFIKKIGIKLRHYDGKRSTSKGNLDRKFIEHNGIIGFTPINERHVALIFVSDSKEDYSNICYDEIAPIIKDFDQKKVNYRLYFCYLTDDFIRIIQSDNVMGVHILGHGRIDAIGFEDGVLIYRELKNTKPKEFVAQWHCNHCDGKSLGELIGRKYYVPYGMTILGSHKKNMIKPINGQIEWTRNINIK